MKKIVKVSLLAMMLLNLASVMPNIAPTTVYAADGITEVVEAAAVKKADKKTEKHEKVTKKEKKISRRQRKKQEKQAKIGKILVISGMVVLLIATIILFMAIKSPKVRYSVTTILGLLIVALGLFFTGIINIPGIPSKPLIDLTTEKEAESTEESTEETEAEESETEETEAAEEAVDSSTTDLAVGPVDDKNYIIGTVKGFSFEEYMAYLRSIGEEEKAVYCEENCDAYAKDALRKYEVLVIEQPLLLNGNDQGTIVEIDGVHTIGAPEELVQYENKKIYLEVNQENVGPTGDIIGMGMTEPTVIEVLD